MQRIIFPKLTFTKPGVYLYTVKELTPSDENWTADRRVYRVVVTVKLSGGGSLAASVSYPDGPPEFINKYHYRPEHCVCRREKVCCCCYCCCCCCRCCSWLGGKHHNGRYSC